MMRLDKFDQYIKSAMDSWHCPGTAVVIVKGNEVLHKGAYGLRDVDDHLPMTEDTRFPAASVTKSFTAMSAALLVDEGKLEWDKPVREYMPEFILDDHYVTQHLTVRDMLSHRSGMPRHDFSAWRLDVSRAEFIKRMRHLKFSATFREKFQYNNLMYYATGYLVEKIAKKHWEDFMQERILSPLGMDASNFVPEPPGEGLFNAIGYRVDRDDVGGAKGLVRMPFGQHTELAPGAAGSLFSTLADLTQWLKVHVNDGRAADVQLVSPDNLKQMHLPQTIIPRGGIREALMGNAIITYGLGWFIEPYRGYTLIHHSGGVEGHSLIIGFIAQEKIAAAALTNIAALPLCELLLYEAIDRALDLPEKHWNTKFHNILDPIIAAEAKGKQTAAEERIEEAPPTHPLEIYTGTYEADGYPDFEVKLEGEKLQACTVGSLEWSELSHYHYNVFEWHLSDFDLWLKIRFLINDNGDIESISIPLETQVDNVIFIRKNPVLSEDVIAEIIGVYDPPIDGLKITIIAHEGKIYSRLTGNPQLEIKPYKYEDDVVGFRVDRTRLDFIRKKNVITHLIYKTQFLTIEAPRQ